MRADLHLDALLRREPILPADGVRRVIDIVFVAIGPLGDTQENTAGDTALQIHAITEGKGAVKGDSTGRGFYGGGAQVGEFIREDRFESARAGCKEGVVCAIHFCLSVVVIGGRNEVLQRVRGRAVEKNSSRR
jgi:hypothetical protein